MTDGTLAAIVKRVRPVDKLAAEAARLHHARLTKPVGSLGRLEDLGIQLSAIAGHCPPPIPEPVTIGVFAGDHGVVASGVTPWPSEVTAQMVANFCAGGAAINVLARQVGATVQVVDVGVATPIPGDLTNLHQRNVAKGTANLAVQPAMTRDQVISALEVGAEIANEALAQGTRMLVTGDMGIGNTTPSAALIAVFTRTSPDRVTGRGTGIDDATLYLKTSIVESAIERIAHDAEPLDIVGELGGLEIAAIAGFIIAGAAAGVPVVVDGVISIAAALIATALAPDVRDYLVAGHRSSEPGASIGMAHLGLTPLLDLELRLGEGTGAALAIPLVQAAARILSEMATFDSAGVTEPGDGA
jgi:nicotinate-nucleotide--dimethylbenzimidazole phosphoribosyltransferase